MGKGILTSELKKLVLEVIVNLKSYIYVCVMNTKTQKYQPKTLEESLRTILYHHATTDDTQM